MLIMYVLSLWIDITNVSILELKQTATIEKPSRALLCSYKEEWFQILHTLPVQPHYKATVVIPAMHWKQG